MSGISALPSGIVLAAGRTVIFIYVELAPESLKVIAAAYFVYIFEHLLMVTVAWIWSAATRLYLSQIESKAEDSQEANLGPHWTDASDLLEMYSQNEFSWSIYRFRKLGF